MSRTVWVVTRNNEIQGVYNSEYVAYREAAIDCLKDALFHRFGEDLFSLVFALGKGEYRKVVELWDTYGLTAYAVFETVLHDD